MKMCNCVYSWEQCRERKKVASIVQSNRIHVEPCPAPRGRKRHMQLPFRLMIGRQMEMRAPLGEQLWHPFHFYARSSCRLKHTSCLSFLAYLRSPVLMSSQPGNFLCVSLKDSFPSLICHCCHQYLKYFTCDLQCAYSGLLSYPRQKSLIVSVILQRKESQGRAFRDGSVFNPASRKN